MCSGGGGRLVVRDAGPVVQAEFAELAVSVHPFAGAGAGDTHLRGAVGDRASLAALDELAAPFDRQRGITVCRGRVFLVADELVVLLILPLKDPSAVFGPDPGGCLQRHDPQQLAQDMGAANACVLGEFKYAIGRQGSSDSPWASRSHYVISSGTSTGRVFGALDAAGNARDLCAHMVV